MDSEGVGGKRHGVFGNVAEVEHQQRIPVALRRRHADLCPEFDALNTRQIGSARTQRSADRAPAPSGQGILYRPLEGPFPAETSDTERVKRHPEYRLGTGEPRADETREWIDLFDCVAYRAAGCVEAVALPGEGRGAREVERLRPIAKRKLATERGLAAVVPLSIEQRNLDSALSLERLDVRLTRGVRLRPAGGEFTGYADVRWDSGLAIGQPRYQPRERRRVETEKRGDSRDKRSGGLETERWTIECRLLRLRYGGEIDASSSERNLSRRAEDGGGRLREHRILLELDRHLARARKKRIGPRERHPAEIVVHRVIGAAHKRDSVHQQPLGVGPHLNGAEHQCSTFAIPLRLVAGADVINRERPLRRFHVLRRRRIDRIVARVEPAGEAIAREWP